MSHPRFLRPLWATCLCLWAAIASTPISAAEESADAQGPWIQASFLNAQPIDGGVGADSDLFPTLPQDEGKAEPMSGGRQRLRSSTSEAEESRGRSL